MSTKKVIIKTKDKANFEKSKKISAEISDLLKKQSISQSEIDKIILTLPNLAQDVPIGKDEKSNKLIKKGDIKKFQFKAKSHVELEQKTKILILKHQ